MATLRDFGLIDTESRPTLREAGLVPRVGPDVQPMVDEASVNGMSQLRRGFVSGRYGAEANALAADESSLRAQGRATEADALRARIKPLQEKASRYAPTEQDATTLTLSEPGRALDYAAGTIGQAAASMLDPVALGVGANAAAGIAARTPLGAAGAAVLRGAGVLGAYGLNYRQAKGEFYNRVADDPQALRRSPEDVDTTASLVGAGAGALDTMLPAAIAGRVVGRPAMKAFHGMPHPARWAADAVGEGLTETAQQGAQLFGHSTLNPLRDTSGDTKELINAGVAGVVGGGGLSAPSHLVSKALERGTGGQEPAATPRSAPEQGVGTSPADDASWVANIMGVGGADLRTSAMLQRDTLLPGLQALAAAGDATAKQHLDAVAAQDPNAPDFVLNRDARVAAATYLTDDEARADAARAALKPRKLNEQDVPEDNTPRTSDDIVDQGEERDAAWEKKGALKNIEKAPGVTQYFFKGGRSAGSTDASLDKELPRHPFVLNKGSKLPTLSRLEDRDSDGTKTLDRIKANAYEALGGEYGKTVATSVRPADRRIVTEQIPPGGFTSTEDDPEVLGVGTDRIRTASAKEVMDNSGVGARERARLLRDYLRRDGVLGEKDPALQQLVTTQRRVDELEQRTPKQLIAPGRGLIDNPEHASLMETKAQLQDAIHDMARRAGVKLTKGDATVQDLANAYFADRHLVVAEQMAERDPLRLPRSEMRMMARRGAESMQWADQYGDEKAAVRADLGLIHFKSPHATTKDGVSTVRASDLVKWANNSNPQEAKGSVGRAEAYRNALLEGIAALAAEGYASELPYVIDAKGNKVSFEKGIPPQLKLGTMTQAQMRAKAAERAKKAAKIVAPSPAGSTEITAAEQMAEFKPGDVDQEVVRQKAEAESVRDELVKRNAVQDAAKPVTEALTPANAMRLGKRIADEVYAQFATDARAAFQRLERLVRDLANKDGGPQYAAPIAFALTPSNVKAILKASKDPERASARLEAMRGAAAESALSFPTHERTQLARALTGDDKLPAPKAVQELKQIAKPKSAYKLNEQSDQIHEELGREGFAATHDSPIRHEGKFDWRAHQGKGEGNAAYGAGTYLSTADGVHKYYKASFTTQVRPEYEYQVADRINDRLRRAVGARTEVGHDAAKIAASEGKDAAITFVRRILNTHLEEGPESTTSRAEFDKWTDRYEALLSAIATIPESDMRPKVGSGYRADKSPTYQVSVNIKPEQLLDWDKRLGAQEPAVRRLLEKAIDERNLRAGLNWYDEPPTGGDVYRELAQSFKSQAKASDYLQSLGILGHVYAAAAGRAKKAPNYVIYDDSKITTNYVHFNEQTTAAGVQSSENATRSDADIEKAKAHIAKVLGPKVRVEFLKEFIKDPVTGRTGTGAWVDEENLIKLSLMSGSNLLSVAHHESMHALFSSLVANHPAAAQALKNVMGRKDMLERLTALLHGHPKAIAAITTGPHAAEERVAYAYQFWAAELLDVDKPATTLFAKVRRVLRTIFGMVRESEVALDIMAAFHDGKLAEPSEAGKVIKAALARQTWNADVKRKLDKQLQAVYSTVAPSNDVLRNSESETAQNLGRMLFTNPGEEDAGGFAEGYLNARARKVRQYTNYLYEAVKGLSERDMADVAKAMQLKTPLDKIAYPPVRKAVKDLRALTKRYYAYATADAGLRLPFLGEDHYPRVWSLEQMVEKKDAFVTMLLQPKYAEVMEKAAKLAKATVQDVAAAMHKELIQKNGVDEEGLDADTLHGDVILDPFFASQKERSFKWLDDADVEPFLEKDLVGAMSRYLHQGVRAAEFARRFGNGGEKLKDMLYGRYDMKTTPGGKPVRVYVPSTIETELRAEAKKQNIVGKAADEWVARRMEDIRNSVGAHEGSLGSDVSPAWRKFSSIAMAYQNVRLLPLSLFAAFGDTLGIAARGGGAGAAFDAFVQGIKDVYARWKDAASDMPAERQKSVWDDIAEMVGAVDSHMFLEQLGKAHTSEFMTDFARKTNRALFMANGLTAWDRSMRVSATKAAVLFIQNHAKLPDAKHSARWLKELGLEPKDVPLDADGKLIVDRHVLAATRYGDDMTSEEKAAVLKEATAQTEKLHTAIVRWVEGAVLTPNAAQRPTWSSDPHYAVLFHLKQFTYSFHHTILKRAYVEAGYGNMTPVAALAAAVPTMIVSDLVKGLVLGGGSLPNYMKTWTLGDHLLHGVNRAGLGGVAALGVEALQNPASLLGPTVEQVTKAVLNPSELGSSIHNAIPGVRYIKDLPDLTPRV